MDNAEVEVALEELENRLERLRALYEQYFMGIERIEPQIPRKDVDRRIYVLRREKIRNTAKRFKLQTIISRYNTFQQYWQRICREIENGTYKRHVIRAERIAPGQMLTIAARKRLGKAALQAIDEDAPAPAARASVPPASAAPPAVEPRPPSFPPLPSLVPRPGIPSLLGKAPPKPGPRPPPKPEAPGVTAAAPGVTAPGVTAPAAAAQRAPAVAPRAPAPSALDLDLDFLGDWDPGIVPNKPKRAPEVPAQPFGRALTQRLGAGPAPAIAAARREQAVPTQTTLAASAKPEKTAAAEQPLVAPPFVSQRPPAPTTRDPLLTRPAPARVGVSAAAPPARPVPAPPAKPLPTAPPRPLPAPLGAKALAAPIPEPSPLATLVAKPPAPVAVRPPAAPPAASPKPASPKPAPPMPSAAALPADARVRELHARLLEAKRQTQDPSTVSMEGLARSMKATEAKLREQHKNRKIDFDVVIKDGKAVLKPIVR
ncbi:MAG: MXAN_5187 C-terminal domain-containing protein [Pseudomonadota bacterium]